MIASGMNRVSVDKLSRHLGVQVMRADADAVKRLTGFPIGGVPPVGHISPLRVFVDEDLMQYREIWAAAGTPHSVFKTTPAELVRITKGEVIDMREAPKTKEP